MSKPKTIYLKDYRPADFNINQVHLHFDLHEDEARVTAVLDMQRNPMAETPDAPLILNGEELELLRVSIDGRALTNEEFKVDDQSLTISSVSDQFKLETEVRIKPQENTQLMGLYKSRQNFCTQCEAEGFRRITYYLDRPDVMSTFSTTISADKSRYPMLLSNGNLIEEKELSDGRHWVHWEDPSKKPSYLFALVAGDFDLLRDEFTTMSGRKIDLRLYLERGFADQGEYALEALKRAMRWDEERWGREYDLDIYMVVAVSDFNMGAMENKGLNVFNTKYILAKPETATDIDYVNIEAVIGHEYFHNWSGNRVTCRDWFQITLKEGLTVFRDSSFTRDMTSRGAARIDVVNVVRNSQFPEDAGPMAHPIRPQSYMEINNFYTSTVYRKGSEVIRMVQTLISPEIFRKGLDLYFERHDGQAVTTEDFIQAMADASGRDFTQFKRWYDQAGTPKLDVTGDYNADAQTYTLHVKQSCSPTPGQSKKLPFHLPLSVGLVGDACSDMTLELENANDVRGTTAVLDITEPEQSFVFNNVAQKPIPSLLRDFSAPVELHFPYEDEELAWLLQCDSDSFSRWDAGQQLAQRIILDLAARVAKDESLALPDLIVDAWRQLLQKPTDDLVFFARLFELPTMNYLLAQMDSVNVDSLYRAHQFVKQQLGVSLESEFLKLFEANAPKNAYIYDQKSMGQRSMRNLCLRYLAATEKADYFQRAKQQFEQADNMTASMGALSALNNFDCAEREACLDAFYSRWKDEPLVVNKWLSLQASSNLPSTLERVRELMAHPAFSIRNPNNVYALLCGFGANTVRFHETHGAGYEFIADQVLAIDSDNPQVAGRVIQPLTHWQQMDDAHGEKMKQALQRISKSQLSPDVYEVVTKSIGE